MPGKSSMDQERIISCLVCTKMMSPMKMWKLVFSFFSRLRHLLMLAVLVTFVGLLPQIILPRSTDLSSLASSSSSSPPWLLPSSLSPLLPPSQLDLLLSRPPPPLLLSRGCRATELRLRCPADHLLVVEAAVFHPLPPSPSISYNCSARLLHSSPVSSLPPSLSSSSATLDIRRALNRRCSGYSSGEECKFCLLLDQPESRGWGDGLAEVWHR